MSLQHKRTATLGCRSPCLPSSTYGPYGVIYIPPIVINLFMYKYALLYPATSTAIKNNLCSCTCSLLMSTVPVAYDNLNGSISDESAPCRNAFCSSSTHASDRRTEATATPCNPLRVSQQQQHHHKPPHHSANHNCRHIQSRLSLFTSRQ